MLLSTRRVVSSATCILSLRPLPSAMRPIPPRTLLPHQATVVAHTLRGADGHETGGMQQPGGHVLALPVVETLPAASLDGATTVLVLGHPPLASPAYRVPKSPQADSVTSNQWRSCRFPCDRSTLATCRSELDKYGVAPPVQEIINDINASGAITYPAELSSSSGGLSGSGAKSTVL